MQLPKRTGNRFTSSGHTYVHIQEYRGYIRWSWRIVIRCNYKVSECSHICGDCNGANYFFTYKKTLRSRTHTHTYHDDDVIAERWERWWGVGGDGSVVYRAAFHHRRPNRKTKQKTEVFALSNEVRLKRKYHIHQRMGHLKLEEQQVIWICH